MRSYPTYIKKAIFVLLSMFLISASLWNYRFRLYPILPGAIQNQLIDMAHLFPDPTDRYSGPMKTIAQMPVFEVEKFKALLSKPDQADEFLLYYVEAAMDRDPYGQEILSYPEPLRYIAAMLTVEWWANNEGFGGYVFDGNADSLRFAQKGYRILGHPELAIILEKLEQKFRAGVVYYLLAKEGKNPEGIETDTWTAYVSMGQALNLSPIDDAWGAYPNWEQLYHDRHSYTLEHVFEFSPKKSQIP